MRVLTPATTAVLVALAACSSGGGAKTFDRNDLNVQIGKQLSEQLGLAVTVACPVNQEVKAGRIFDCVGTGGGDARIVRVTVNDNQGHYRFEVTAQKP